VHGVQIIRFNAALTIVTEKKTKITKKTNKKNHPAFITTDFDINIAYFYPILPARFEWCFSRKAFF
jgi:hypothetical protein